MNYTSEDLSFILYNNRSIKGVVSNFINSKWDGYKISDIEEMMDHFRSLFDHQKFIEVNREELIVNADDVVVKPIAIKELTDKVIDSNKNLSGIEKEYLLKRGINEDTISIWRIGGLSSIKEEKDLVTLNATVHPVLRNIIEDGIEGGGIIIPLFENDELINCAIRKISDIGKLKYALACPDVDIWGINDIENEEVWIVEGLFDMMALRSIGLKAVSVSSAMWSGIQLYRLIEKNPKSIVVFCDNDNVGLKSGFIMQKVFSLHGIKSKTVISNSTKDASEMIFEKKLGLDICDINITVRMINNTKDNFDFISYIKNRKF